MADRPYLPPYPVIRNGDMSQASITSLVTVLKQLTGASYAYSWSGTAPVGSITVQASNDYSLNADGSVNNPGTWTNLTMLVDGTPSETISVTGNTGTRFADLDEIMSYAIRTVYTKVSGTGSLQVTVVGKVA